MSQIIFDIETVGEDYSKLDEKTQEAMTSWIKRESKNDDEYENALDQLKDGMGFSPLTGEIVSVAMLDSATDKGAVYFQAPESDIADKEENGIKYRKLGEKEIIEHFWEVVKKYRQVVTFNGRSFDVPFVLVRGAIHGIRPPINLMPYRYATDTTHIDLYDQLTYYGSTRKKGNLHLWCRAFGIKSPKENGVTGNDVAKLFKEKKYEEIARYNLDDVFATRELFRKWESYLKF